MSINREDFGVTYEVNAGTRKTITMFIEKADGTVQDMTDVNIYNTGSVKIYKPNGTVIATESVTFVDRATGECTFQINETENTNANAGNWIGEIEFSNTVPVVIDQRKFNFNIIESY